MTRIYKCDPTDKICAIFFYEQAIYETGTKWKKILCFEGHKDVDFVFRWRGERQCPSLGVEAQFSTIQGQVKKTHLYCWKNRKKENEMNSRIGTSLRTRPYDARKTIIYCHPAYKIHFFHIMNRIFWFWFDGVSTIVGYLMPKSIFIHIVK